jgi:hypothetical protein
VSQLPDQVVFVLLLDQLLGLIVCNDTLYEEGGYCDDKNDKEQIPRETDVPGLRRSNKHGTEPGGCKSVVKVFHGGGRSWHSITPDPA